MKRAAIYTRVSTAEQSKKGVSLEHQLNKCRLQAELLDYQIDKEIVEPGKSAKNLEREGMQELISMIKDKSIDAVIIYKLDRLTRNVSDLNYLIALLVKKGVELISVKDSLNTSTASGRMVINMLGTISQWEREQIAERTQEALQYKKHTNQRYSAITPYGYNDENKILKKNDKEQTVILRILNLREHLGLSWQKIEDKLNQDKIATRLGGAWRRQTVRKVFMDTMERLNTQELAFA